MAREAGCLIEPVRNLLQPSANGDWVILFGVCMFKQFTSILGMKRFGGADDIFGCAIVIVRKIQTVGPSTFPFFQTG